MMKMKKRKNEKLQKIITKTEEKIERGNEEI